MGSSNSNGQGTIELLLIMILFVSLLVSARQLTKSSARAFQHSQLSRVHR